MTFQSDVQPMKKKKTQSKVKSYHDEDVELMDEDVAYFQEHGEFLEFLENMQVDSERPYVKWYRHKSRCT